MKAQILQAQNYGERTFKVYSQYINVHSSLLCHNDTNLAEGEAPKFPPQFLHLCTIRFQ